MKALWDHTQIAKALQDYTQITKALWGYTQITKALWDYTQIAKALWNYTQITKALWDYTQIRTYPEQSCPMNLNGNANIPAARVTVEQFTHGGKYPGCYCHTTALGKLTFIIFKITDGLMN